MLITVDVPGGTRLDGAVVELAVAPDGTVTAEVRIPAPDDRPPSFASSI